MVGSVNLFISARVTFLPTATSQRFPSPLSAFSLEYRPSRTSRVPQRQISGYVHGFREQSKLLQKVSLQRKRFKKTLTYGVNTMPLSTSVNSEQSHIWSRISTRQTGQYYCSSLILGYVIELVNLRRHCPYKYNKSVN